MVMGYFLIIPLSCWSKKWKKKKFSDLDGSPFANVLCRSNIRARRATFLVLELSATLVECCRMRKGCRLIWKIFYTSEKSENIYISLYILNLLYMPCFCNRVINKTLSRAIVSIFGTQVYQGFIIQVGSFTRLTNCALFFIYYFSRW